MTMTSLILGQLTDVSELQVRDMEGSANTWRDLVYSTAHREGAPQGS